MTKESHECFKLICLCHAGNHMVFLRNGYTWMDSDSIHPSTPGIPDRLREQDVTALADIEGIRPSYWDTPGVVPQYIITGDDEYEYVDGSW